MRFCHKGRLSSKRKKKQKSKERRQGGEKGLLAQTKKSLSNPKGGKIKGSKWWKKKMFSQNFLK
jgi:hypothetical protein